MTTRDPHATPPTLGYDPAQLSLGDVAAVPQLRFEQQDEESGGAREASAVGFHEPPVCGESSYDDVEDAGPSWSMRIVHEVESSPVNQRGRGNGPQRQSEATAGSAMRPAGTAWTAAAAKSPGGAPASGESARTASTRTGSTRATASMHGSGPHPIPDVTSAPMRPTPVAVPSAALDPLKRSTEMSPRDAAAAIAYANALEKHGNTSAALAALDDCVASGGDELRLICARVYLLGSRLKYELAEAELKRAAKLRADDPEVQLQAGILACRRARWRDAVEPLQKAASQRAEDALAHFYLGEALNHVDQLAPALQAYDMATRLDPANWRAFKGVGIVLDRLGRPTDAAVAYRHMREAQGR